MPAPSHAAQSQQRRRRAGRLGLEHLEWAGHLRGSLSHLWMAQVGNQVGMLGQGGHNRHQVRLAGALVADNEKALVVAWGGELELRKDSTDAIAPGSTPVFVDRPRDAACLLLPERPVLRQNRGY